MNQITKAILFSALTILVSGCMPESGSDDAGMNNATAMQMPNSTNANTPEAGTMAAMGGSMVAAAAGNAAEGSGADTAAQDCEFDESKKGKAVGKQIEDFPLQQWTQGEDGNFEPSRFDFHSNCGGGAKVIWVFLSTGWCGACERYAAVAQEQYATLKDQGLRIVWIVGEDAEKAPPTKEYMQLYASEKMVEFPIIRDGEFLQTKRFIDPSVAGNSLPRSYVINAKNMEMKYAGGISMNTSICAMLTEMDVPTDGIDCP